VILLTGPFGHDALDFASVSLYARDDIEPLRVAEILHWYGCYPPAVPRVLSCLKYSNQYDCYVQRGWVVTQCSDAIRAFADVGVLFVINRVVKLGREQPVESLFK